MLHIGDGDLAEALGESGRDAVVASVLNRRSGDGARLSWRDPLRWAADAAELPAAGEVLEQAQTTLDAGPVDFTAATVGRSRLYGLHYLSWTRPLLQAYAVTGDARFVGGWADHFDQWHASRTKVRGQWPGLDVVWYSLGVGVRCDVLVEALDVLPLCPDVAERVAPRVLATLLGHLRWLAEEHDRFRFGNWQVVASASLLHAATAVPGFTESAEWRSLARSRIEEHLALDFYSDGGHSERSPGYHVLAVQSLHKVAVAAETYLGWDLAGDPRLAASHTWLARLAMPDGHVPPFNDSPVVDCVDTLTVGQHLAPDPSLRELVHQVADEIAVRTALAGLPARPGRTRPWQDWRSSQAAAQNETGATPPGSVLLASSKFAVMRGDPARPDLYAAVNLGPHVPHELESHSHRTCLDMVAAAHGQAVVWEAGGPTSYDDPLYQSWYQSAVSHSGVVIDGRDGDDDRDGTVEVFRTSRWLDVLIADNDGDGSRHRRTVLSVKGPGPAWWLVRDRLSGGSRYRWTVHGRSPWRRDATGWRSETGPGVFVRPLETAEGATAEGPTRWPDRSIPGGRPGVLHTLSLDNDTGRFDVLLAPFGDGDTRPSGPRLDQVSDDELRVTDGPWTDEVNEHQWVRHVGGEPLAGCSWIGSLSFAGRRLVDGQHVAWSTWDAEAGAVAATFETTRRTVVHVSCPDTAVCLLNGVQVPVQRRDGGSALQVPSAGTWLVSAETRP